jgi:hypothetical protein
MPASYVVFGENEKKRERKRVRKKNDAFFLSSRRPFAYFSTHTYACNLISHSRSFDDGNDALKWVKIKKEQMRCAIGERERKGDSINNSGVRVRTTERAYRQANIYPPKYTTFGLLCIYPIMTGRARKKYQLVVVFVDGAVAAIATSSWRTD